MNSHRFKHPPLLVSLALSVAAICIIVLAQPSRSARMLVSQWQPAPMITRPDQPGAQAAAPPVPITGAVVPVAALDISVADGLYPAERDALHGELADAFAYVVARFGSPPSGRFTTAIMRDDSCGIHGIAYTDVRTVQVFTCAGIDHSRAVNILAHEITHQLEQDRYGPAHLRADLILSEGMATWAAGKYWLGNTPDFATFVRAQRDAGVFYPLATHYNGLGVTAMNALYYEWASFVDFLIGQYGREKFDQLYVSGHNVPGSADYAGVYGKPLPQLEHEWQAWLGK